VVLIRPAQGKYPKGESSDELISSVEIDRTAGVSIEGLRCSSIWPKVVLERHLDSYNEAPFDVDTPEPFSVLTHSE